MPRILIAGCGYVGQATADLFHEKGWAVVGWTASPHSAAQLSGKPYPVRDVDISAAAAISNHPPEFDVVILCASSGGGSEEAYRRIYSEAARNLLRTFASATLLFTSSTSVYAQTDGEIVDEESPAHPAHEKGRILRETEEFILARNGIVARLGGIYGPNRSFLLRKFLAGEAVIDRDDDHFINQVHRDDITSALWRLTTRRAESAGGIYNVVDDQPVLTREMYEWLSSALKRPLLPIGKAAMRRKRGASNKRVSNRKLRALGWEPRYSTFAAAMIESVFPSFGLQSR